MLAALLCLALTAGAQVCDALCGVWPVTDGGVKKSLNGTWQLKVINSISDDRTVPEADASWGEIPVPGCWEAYGFCEPKYDYPDSLTGYYRTTFTVPQEWRGQQVMLRLDGVLRGYDLWLNDQLVGTWESGYNTCQFDLTPYLSKKAFKGEPQRLAMRVYSRFKGYEFDCFDDWATMGIFRDVTLFSVPRTHVSDLTVTTRMTGEVNVQVSVADSTRQTSVECQLYDREGRIVGQGRQMRVTEPRLWTAETPYLYTLRVLLKQKGQTLQTIEQKVGIKELTIDGNVMKLNGQPIKLRGVNAHSTDPRTVKVISDELTLKDMRMMKEASVNYMRLSHYPREPRFYELADSLGFYLVSEVPFGYGDKHLSGRSYQPILMERARATVSRDKNHPSVLVWSVGNENPLPQTCVEVGDYVGRLDPSRPYCYPQVGSYFRRFWEKNTDASKRVEGDLQSPFPSKAPVYAPHYPTTSQIAGFYQTLDRPVIFTEYCHTLGISFEDHDRQWEIIERTPGIAGGSVWEWADQGMPFRSEKGKVKSEKFLALQATKGRAATARKFGYEEKVYTSGDSGFQMYGNKGTDGLVYADRTPLPNYYELQHNYARAAVTDSILTVSYSVVGDLQSPTLTLHIRNRYDFLNLKDNVTFRWAYTEDRDTVATGAFSPDCPPHQTTEYQLSIVNSQFSIDKVCLLNLEISDAKGLVFLRQSIPVGGDLQSPTDITSRLLAGLTIPTENPMSTVQDGLLVRAGRKATLAETLKVGDKRLERYLLHLSPDGTQAGSIKTDIKTEPVGNATHVTFSLTPDTVGGDMLSPDTFLSELGIAMLLDKRIDRVQWIGNGPYATYPGRFRAGRYGFWAMQQGDLYFEGNRRGVDAALLTDAEGNGLLLVCDNGNVSFEQTDGGIVLTYNAAVSGQGPKFARTAFPVIAREVGTVSGDFYLYRVDADRVPQLLQDLFDHPSTIPAPFRPYETQYDTYLMRYEDIIK